MGESVGVVMPYGCRRGICFGCLTPLTYSLVRDLRTGEVHDRAGQLIQTCVSAAAGPLALDAQPPKEFSVTVPPRATTETESDFDKELGEELDRIRSEIIAARGADDARYIRTVIAAQRGLETGGRVALAVSLFPPAWAAGTAMLSVAKILENMELGHNILHGQWYWMGDPAIHSTTWEWDFLTPADVHVISPSRSTTSCSHRSSSGASRSTTWSPMPSPPAGRRDVPSRPTSPGSSPRPADN
ncbi:hypothetical protein AB0H77_25800 [Streptomyces sp. NPDC050844]|uniref:hypothetical protein n=1 Tax=Streptomyces sp. NPDC050844 TaxID=3155790 RepID=UPI00340055F0